MKVLFIQRDPFVKFGITILSSILKKNFHECDILVENLEKDITKKVHAINPDIIAFSITTNEYSWMSEIGQKIRKKFKKLIICGGPYPTFYQEVINEDYLDAICIGEGEGAILDLVNILERGEDITRINNLIVKKDGQLYRNEIRPLISDLDLLPLSDISIYYRYNFFKNQKSGYILTGRGCPYQCTFCFNKSYNEMYKGKGKIIRRRQVSEVIKEIKILIKEVRNIEHINFLDDTFILSKSWLNEFLERYKIEIDLPFSCTARANLINEDIVQKLKDANCFSIRLGVESANESLRNTVLKKGITNEQIIKSTGIIKKYGIKLQIYNMLGTPGETLETAFETLELNKKIRPTYAWCSLLQPYPKTEVFEYAAKNNYFNKDYNFKNLENSYFMVTPIQLKNKKEIYNLQKIFSISVFLQLPVNLVKVLIKLPFTRVYELVFKVNYAIGILRIDNLSFWQIIKTAIYSKNYFKK